MTVAAMNYSAASDPAPRTRPRIWLGVAIILLQWLIIRLPVYVAYQTMFQFMAMLIGPLVGLLGLLIWLALSRVSWRLRLFGLIALLAWPVLAFTFAHPSMKMGMIVAALPIANTAFVLGCIIALAVPSRLQPLILLLIPLCVWTFFTLRRSEGLNGNIEAATFWRWTPSFEDQYLAKVAKDPSLAGRGAAAVALPTSMPALTLSTGDWPAFRGANRDGKLTGVTINKDWSSHPPKLLWKHLIGPGWSSCSVVGDRIFTQDQRGGFEAVACYDLNTGQEVWVHQDETRFTESMAGPGPRATPTFDQGRIYAQGANGVLNCLDAGSGQRIWTRNVMTDNNVKLPNWGFSASPMVADGLVTVIVGFPNGKNIAAYSAADGKPAWTAGQGFSYASVQLSRLDGVDQLLGVTQNGVAAFDPQSGQMIWQHSFVLTGGANRVTQPLVLNDSELLLGAAFGVGTRRIKITHDGGVWKDQEVWTSRSLKPYYNDMVLHKDNVYGFDGSVFVCFDPQGAKARWRTHDYGNGQVLLIEDQELLLVLSETGEVALVEAKPDDLHEIGRFQAIDGKSWNHPAIAHDRLIVRNGQEIACYDMK